jgi:hypothetical protein
LLADAASICSELISRKNCSGYIAIKVPIKLDIFVISINECFLGKEELKTRQLSR